MVFSSSVFLFCFLPLLLILNFISKDRYRNYILLIFSLIFYGWGEPRFLMVMVLIVMIDYFMALFIDFTYETKGDAAKKTAGLFIAVTVVSNLGLLAYFKYTGFLVSSFNSVFHTDWIVPKIVLPIGISFFTFQAMSYVIDVYRKDVKAQKNPFYVLLYVSLFPQLVAGPIVRYKTVENEIISRNISINNIARGLERFILGMAKKVIIANNTGQLADTIFNGAILSTPTAWIGAIAYTLQIYFDFSAYSDMAIGLGLILGFHFDENFNYPYISKSVTEFWRRWHISLSTWFRDYVYIPLGGNRKGKAKQIINLLIVWTLTGFWHGAAWNFLLWGFYYFLLLMIEKLFLGRILKKIPAIFAHLYTILCFTFGWVLFRAETLEDCIQYVKIMLTPHFTEYTTTQAVLYLHKYGIYLVFGLLLSVPVYGWIRSKLSKIGNKAQHTFLYACSCIALLGLFIITIAYFVNSTYNPFIYFRF